MADETATAPAPAAEAAPAVIETMADLAASVEPKPPAPKPAGPIRFPITLDEFCTAHSKVRRGEVELMGAFYFVMKAKGPVASATEDVFRAQFDEFAKSHKPI